MCLALCLTSMPANAADEMANTLVYAGENEDTINPLLNNHQELPTIIFSGLMKYDAKGQPVPELAESFTYDKGAHTNAFKLRNGVKWHDGKPLTVEDILFTYEALTKDKTLASSITSNYEDIKSITAPDAQTVVFTLSKPNAAMLDNFTIGILPKHLFAGKDINTAPANQHPVGTGRYKFVEWDTAGGMIILEKNKDYYGKVPNIDRIVYKTVAVESTKALMLQSGEADLAWLNAKYADTFRGKDGYKNIDFATADYRSAAMDFHTDFWKRNGDSIGVLNYALNKDAIAKSVLNGQGFPAFSPIQMNAYGGNKAADIYSYDLKKFAAEMEKLGWKKGKDGIYERNGQKFSFTIQVRDYEEERVDIAKVIANELKKAGVDMQIVLVTKFDWKAGYNGFLAGFAAEFFTERNADGGRRMRHDDLFLLIEDVFDLVDEAHLFDGVERAGDQALTAVEARVFGDFMLGAETALDGVGRAELAAGVAADAVLLVDVDNPAEFALAKITDVGGTVFPVGVGARQEGMDRDRIFGH